VRYLIHIAIAFAIVLPAMIARAIPPSVCATLPQPAAGEVAQWQRAKEYASGLKAFEAGRWEASDRALTRSWNTLRNELGRVFFGGSCDSPRIRTTLDRLVFTAPARAVPADDRFLPPRVVALAVARARCESGRLADAAYWLLANTTRDDPASIAAAAVLLATDGKGDVALALLPPASTDELVTLARAYAMDLLGRSGLAIARSVPMSSDRQAAAIRALMDGRQK
jgi:hypothetical protein